MRHSRRASAYSFPGERRTSIPWTGFDGWLTRPERKAPTMSTFPIETLRLRIRPFVLDDWPAVHAYTSDAKTMTYIDDGAMTEEQTRQFVSDNLGDAARHFAVELRADDRLIGHFAFYPWYAP